MGEQIMKLTTWLFNSNAAVMLLFTLFIGFKNVSFVSAFAGDILILDSNAVSNVYGGANTSSGGSLKGPSVAATTKPKTPVDITLKNVPYINQYTNNVRSNNYCGLASALMVRGKDKRGVQKAPFMNEQTTIISNLERVDDNLLFGLYNPSGYYNPEYKIDVAANGGLLYVSQYGDRISQYNKSVEILTALYLSKNNDFISDDYNHVSKVQAKILKRDYNAAANEIWNHIENFQQPVVIVVDSRMQYYIDKNMDIPDNNKREIPALHYMVVVGIVERFEKIFRVLDPADKRSPFEYSAKQLGNLMCLPPNTPAWVYKHPKEDLNIYDPCYILFIQGD
jgi:hypothetical protein